jgi:type VI protein secretion system component VasF
VASGDRAAGRRVQLFADHGSARVLLPGLDAVRGSRHRRRRHHTAGSRCGRHRRKRYCPLLTYAGLAVSTTLLAWLFWLLWFGH